MQTKETLEKYFSEMEYKDWFFKLGYNKEVPYLQIKFMAADNMNPDAEPYMQNCRKWMLSYYMTADEILTTALKAVLGAEEHEARELFKWKGEPIYRPHVDPEALYEISKANRVLKRDEADYKADFEMLGGGV